ncbi:MAG: hypothetical protein GXP03_15535 [Alphaproteobacteria bacterium]|nr:hypothetical protein [Alphaproteobacteria bacterium]
MNGTDEPNQLSPGVALSRSIGNDGMDFILSSADTLFDKLISSGAIDGVPVVGLLSGAVKSVREVRDYLYLKKVINFLQGLDATTKVERNDFVCKLEKDGRMETFGETILLILESIDEATKPAIVGRILAAHISGKIASYDQAMRLVAIVNRVYVTDIAYLSSFCAGLPEDEDVAVSLFAAGLLAQTGFDGGGADQDLKPGGNTYELNEYGCLLIAHGMK